MGRTHLSGAEAINVGHGPVQHHGVAPSVSHDTLEDQGNSSSPPLVVLQDQSTDQRSDLSLADTGTFGVPVVPDV